MVLRELFASFGIDFDSEELERGAKRVNEVADALKKLATTLSAEANEAVDDHTEAQQKSERATKSATVATKDASLSMQDLVGRAQQLAGVLGAGLAFGAIRSFVRESIEMGARLRATSSILGVSTQAFQAWSLGAQRAGLQTDQLVDIMGTLAQRAGEASRNSSGTNGQIFRRLGVDVRGANGELKSADELLSDVARGLQTLPTQADRVGVAMDLFTDKGRVALPLLARVADEGVGQLYREIERLGGGLSDDFVAAADATAAAGTRLDFAFQGLRSRIGIVLLPVVTRLTDAVTDLLGRFFEAADQTEIVRFALLTLGGIAAATAVKMIIAWGATLLPFLALAAGIVAATILIEDLWSSVANGRGTFADFTEAAEDFFEMNRDQQGWVADLAREWEKYVRIVEEAIDVVAQFFGAEALPDRSEFTSERGLRPPGEAAPAQESGLARLGRAMVGRDGPESERGFWETLTTPAAQLYPNEEEIQFTSRRGLVAPEQGVRAPVVEQTNTFQFDVADPTGILRLVQERMQREQAQRAAELAEAVAAGGE